MQRDERFKKLFYKNYNPLCNVAYNYLQDRQLAEDLVQDTLIRFWEQKKDSLPDNEAGYYLFQAVKNNCVSQLRKKVRFISIDEEPEAASVRDDEGNELELERRQHLERAIALLPEKCRVVFLMSKIDNLKYKEIADQLGISVKTVENHVAKAIQVIRGYFSNHVASIWLAGILLSYYYYHFMH